MKEMRKGKTAIVAAVEMDLLKFVEFLLKKEANVDITDFEDQRALDIALLKGHTEICSLLFDYYRRTNRNHYLDKVSDSCIGRKKVISINRLDVKDCSGKTALHYAIENDKFEIVLMLIENGCSIDLDDDENLWTPLHYGVVFGSCDIIKTLIEKGCKLWERDCCGRTPISIACEYGLYEKFKLIYDAFVQERQYTPQSTLQKMFSKNPLDICDRISKFSPLHYAVKYRKSYFGDEDIRIIRLLLEGGCNLHIKSVSGEKAIAYTEKEETISLIKSYY